MNFTPRTLTHSLTCSTPPRTSNDLIAFPNVLMDGCNRTAVCDWGRAATTSANVRSITPIAAHCMSVEVKIQNSKLRKLEQQRERPHGAVPKRVLLVRTHTLSIQAVVAVGMLQSCRVPTAIVSAV